MACNESKHIFIHRCIVSQNSNCLALWVRVCSMNNWVWMKSSPAVAVYKLDAWEKKEFPTVLSFGLSCVFAPPPFWKICLCIYYFTKMEPIEMAKISRYYNTALLNKGVQLPGLCSHKGEKITILRWKHRQLLISL